MRLTRKLAWTVTPLVALSLGVGGFAAAAWHTADNYVPVGGKMAVLQPVTMTATVDGPIWPGKALVLNAHFNNPNPVDVKVDNLEANSVTYVIGSHWSDTAINDNGGIGAQLPDVPASMGRDWGPSQFPVANMFDMGNVGVVAAKGHSDVKLTNLYVDPAFFATLAQGSVITFKYNVNESSSAF